MAKTIKVLKISPGKMPEAIEIEDELSALQAAVGGYVESVTFSPDMVVLCNGDGRRLNLRSNCMIGGICFVGDILITGKQDDELSDLPQHIVDRIIRDCKPYWKREKIND